MLTRRHFIRDTASTMVGMVVVGGGVGGATTARVQPAGTGERRQVIVGGRRVTTVDVHSHCERHLVAVYGASQIMIATDYPYPWTATPRDGSLPRFLAVDHVLGTPGLSDADRVAILGGNAANLFNIPV